MADCDIGPRCDGGEAIEGIADDREFFHSHPRRQSYEAFCTLLSPRRNVRVRPVNNRILLFPHGHGLLSPNEPGHVRGRISRQKAEGRSARMPACQEARHSSSRPEVAPVGGVTV